MVQEFCKRDESLEDEECSGWLLEVDNDQLRAVVEVDGSYNYMKVAERLSMNHSMGIQHLKQTGKVKKLNK